MKSETKCCRMCGGPLEPGARTKEHVIPDWLMIQFALKKERISYTPVELEGGASLQATLSNAETPRRSHAIGGLLLGSVCATCNHGWMSRLEVEVKPDLTALVGNADARPTDPASLARWVLKTAYALSQFLSPPVGRVPRVHGVWPRDHGSGLPPGVAVFHRQMPERRFWFSAPLTFVVEGAPRERVELRHRSSYRYIFQIGHALFVVQFWPDSTVRLAYDERIVDLLAAAGPARAHSEPPPDLPQPWPELEILLATRYELPEPRAPLPGEMCHCGSGVELAACVGQGHRERLADNCGWI